MVSSALAQEYVQVPPLHSHTHVCCFHHFSICKEIKMEVQAIVPLILTPSYPYEGLALLHISNLSVQHCNLWKHQQELSVH